MRWFTCTNHAFLLIEQNLTLFVTRLPFFVSCIRPYMALSNLFGLGSLSFPVKSHALLLVPTGATLYYLYEHMQIICLFSSIC